MTSAKATPKNLTKPFNRIMYISMLLLTLYQLVLNGDVAGAMSTLGIGLIFDPFDQEVRWNNRPLYQRAILLVHVIAVFVLLGIAVIW